MRVGRQVKDLIGSTERILTMTLVTMRKGKKKVPNEKQRNGPQSLVILVVMTLRITLRRKGEERISKAKG